MGTAANEIKRRFELEEQRARDVMRSLDEEDRYIGPGGVGSIDRVDLSNRARELRAGAAARVKAWAEAKADRCRRDAARHQQNGRTNMAAEAAECAVAWQQAADSVEA